jgi:hypothetical protein
MASTECLQEAVRLLVAKRQTLRERDESRSELESNRSSSQGRQQQLPQALIDRCIRRADSSRKTVDKKGRKTAARNGSVVERRDRHAASSTSTASPPRNA